MALRPLLWLAGLSALVALPFVLGKYGIYVASDMCITAVIAQGQNFVTGVAGQPSISQAAFAAIGAYGATLLATRLGVPQWLGIPVAALLAASVGYLMGLPALRVSGPYLALVTIGFTAIFQTMLIHWTDLTNGPVGLSVPPLKVFGVSLTSARDLYFVILVVTLAMFLVAGNILRSRVGRAFQALRQSETAGQVLGVNPLHYKTLAFSLAAFYGAMGGGLQGQLNTFLSPETFGISDSIFYLTVVVVGGMGSVPGSVIGAVILTLLPEVLGGLKDYQALAYGVLLLGFCVFVPGGLAGLFRDLAGRVARRG